MQSFRFDINALRAIAIAIVVGFHFKIPWLTGGFIGVDVFFVVSGFLMTQIIWKKLEGKAFSLAGFYFARFKRIVPALGVTCLTLLVAGYFWIDPLSFRELSDEAISALLFYSNYRFYTVSGYFDGASATKILLHTWSLSVEWQFYMLYPLALMAIHRYARSSARLLLVAFAAVSFAFAVYISVRQPAFGFYLLPARAWEMALGGLVCLYGDALKPPDRFRPGLAYAGAGLIFLSAVMIDSTMPWPAWATLPPTLATALVIAVGYRSGRLMENPAVKSLGLWSYSIYLWHWPVLITLSYFDRTSLVWRGAGLALTLLLAMASYYGVEKRCQSWLDVKKPMALAASFAGVAATLFAFAFVALDQGLPTRFGGDAGRFAQIAAATKDWDDPKLCSGVKLFAGEIDGCSLGAGKEAVLLFGDSFAEQLYPRMAALVGKNPALTVDMATSGGCPPLPGVDIKRPGAACNQFNRAATQAALSRPYRLIIIASIWSTYFQQGSGMEASRSQLCFIDGQQCRRPTESLAVLNAYRASFDRLAHFIATAQSSGTKVMIVLPTPFPSGEQRNIPIEIAKADFFRTRVAVDAPPFRAAAFREKTDFIRTELTRVAAQTGAILYDPTPELCPDGTCPLTDSQGLPIYKDGVHLRSRFVRAAPLRLFDRDVLMLAGSLSAEK